MQAVRRKANKRAAGGGGLHGACGAHHSKVLVLDSSTSHLLPNVLAAKPRNQRLADANDEALLLGSLGIVLLLKIVVVLVLVRVAVRRRSATGLLRAGGLGLGLGLGLPDGPLRRRRRLPLAASTLGHRGLPRNVALRLLALLRVGLILVRGLQTGERPQTWEGGKGRGEGGGGVPDHRPRSSHRRSRRAPLWPSFLSASFSPSFKKV